MGSDLVTAQESTPGVSRGDAVEVRMACRSGFSTLGEVEVEEFWRPATVVAVQRDGVIGVVFADSQRLMVRPEQWRKPA